MPAKVVVRDLEKRYGGVEAAAGISFEIQDGEIFGLLGPNGAGKTTTVECIIGLREPDAGSIEVCGIDARRRPLAPGTMCRFCKILYGNPDSCSRGDSRVSTSWA